MRKPRTSYSNLASLAGTLHFIAETTPLGWSYTLPIWALTRGTTASRQRNSRFDITPHVQHLQWWRDLLSVHKRNTTSPGVLAMRPPTRKELGQAVYLFSDSFGNGGFGCHDVQGRWIHAGVIPCSLWIECGSDTLPLELFPLLAFLRSHASHGRNSVEVEMRSQTSCPMRGATSGSSAVSQELAPELYGMNRISHPRRASSSGTKQLLIW